MTKTFDRLRHNTSALTVFALSAFGCCALAATIAQAQTEPTTANPTPGPCGPLFSRLLAVATQNPANRIQAVWSTTYYANGVRYAGLSEVLLRAEGSDLVGEGERHRRFFEGDHATLEKVSLRFRQDTSVILSGQYGPYRATCSADRFAVLYTGDSVETFHFSAMTTAAKPPVEKPRPRPIPIYPYR
jgi:hypothetical protein